MQFRYMAVCCVLGMGSLIAAAQTGGAASGPAAGTIATPAAALDCAGERD